MAVNNCYNCFCERESSEGPCPRCGYEAARDQGKYPFALPHGSILAGRYITGRVLGQGGFGITYLALDNQLKTKVAIKEFMPDSMAVRTAGMLRITVYSGQRQENFQYGMERFLEEARVLAKFQENPNIVGVRSYFEENGTAYFVMEYVEGVSFKSYIQEHGGRVSWEEAARLLMPVMDALEAVHREGIIHRDVTPDNIFITSGGGVKLLDFGSARYSLGDKSRSLDVVLKAGYAPKEQYTRRGRQGPYTDVYSLSACLYSAITGYLPPESLDRADEDELVLPSTRGIKIPQAVEDVILHGLEVQPADRYQSMGELRAALAAAMAEPAAELTPAPPPSSAPEAFAPAQTTNENPPPEPSAAPPETSPETDAETPPSVRRMGKPGKYGLIAAGSCALLLICLMVYLTAGKSTPSTPDTPQSETENLPGATDSLSEADEFLNQHPSEAMIVVVPSDSDIDGLEDLFGKLIAISDMSAHYQDAYTGSIPDAISLYGEENVGDFGEDETTAYSYLISGMADAAIMNRDSVRGMFFDVDGGMIPEVRILDTEWTLESASVGKPANLEPEQEPEPAPEPDPKEDLEPKSASEPVSVMPKSKTNEITQKDNSKVKEDSEVPGIQNQGSKSEYVTNTPFKCTVSGRSLEGLYTGEWKKGVPEGSGTLKDEYTSYIGGWKNGCPNGQGTYDCPGWTYSGVFVDGNLSKGRGTYEDGSYYEGEYGSSFERNGKATWYDAKTSITYVGTWRHEIFSDGIAYRADGSKYWEGHFYGPGVPHMRCIEYDASGKVVYDGNWNLGEWDYGTYYENGVGLEILNGVQTGRQVEDSSSGAT